LEHYLNALSGFEDKSLLNLLSFVAVLFLLFLLNEKVFFEKNKSKNTYKVIISFDRINENSSTIMTMLIKIKD
jgi:hypothetical protein